VRIKGIIRWGKCAFYNVGEFYVFQLKLLHFPNELLAENWRYIHGDINDEP